jgi:hypothetical protein
VQGDEVVGAIFLPAEADVVPKLTSMDEDGGEEQDPQFSSPADAPKEERLFPLSVHQSGPKRDGLAFERLSEAGNPVDVTGGNS